MTDKKPYQYLKALLGKERFANQSFHDFLAADSNVERFEISDEHNFEGVLYVKNSEERRPKWAQLADSLVGEQVEQLTNRSSSAVLIIRVDGGVLAFPFGYGRFLLNITCFEQDFGLKSALNTLDHESLRSIDLHTLEDQPIQKKSQTLRGSEASVFGIDIFKDVLRAVTGAPRPGVNYKNIAGGDAIYSFGVEMLVNEFPRVAGELVDYYRGDLYKTSFSWVDNIRRIKDGGTISDLDQALVNAIKNNDQDLVITLPEIIKWDEIRGFSFTRTKGDITPTIESAKYLDNVDAATVSVESIKRDRLYVTDIHQNEFNYSIYTCLYLEIDQGDTKKIIFGGVWYEIDKSFMSEIESILSQVEVTDIAFPPIEEWIEEDKYKIETEADYNVRASAFLGCHLLDKKLVKSTKTTSPIELCDLFTAQRQLIHAKHRKGGSAGLSHLFAQGNVSAEVLLGDRTFRKKARTVLRRVNPLAVDLVPIDGLKSADYEVVFLILGADSNNVKQSLPFFSKVNLARTFENLSQRGFTVRIGGAAKVSRENA
ncbi:TIGR04141 family sporadically distributed protein [Salinisphaera sp. C84B14]|uniref:TIGR04141 family sporadically distributed protein n=1 Tax=Salinisphaera sp. C84B14 TaxID=1304155 RepID=UPI00333FF022